MQAAGGLEALLEPPEHHGEDNAERAMEALIGSAKVSECCSIAAATQGWAS
jgi:hypothetical protein